MNYSAIKIKIKVAKIVIFFHFNDTVNITYNLYQIICYLKIYIITSKYIVYIGTVYQVLAIPLDNAYDRECMI